MYNIKDIYEEILSYKKYKIDLEKSIRELPEAIELALKKIDLEQSIKERIYELMDIVINSDASENSTMKIVLQNQISFLKEELAEL